MIDTCIICRSWDLDMTWMSVQQHRDINIASAASTPFAFVSPEATVLESTGVVWRAEDECSVSSPVVKAEWTAAR